MDGSTTPSAMRGVEVSVVGSPEVFGSGSQSTPSVSAGDERVIERCDLASSDGSGDRRPPKKRFVVQQPSPDELGASRPAIGDDFQRALNRWEWVVIDGVRLPAVLRGNERFAAVQMIQMRLLAKYPPNIPGELMRRCTMVSHKMSIIEAWIFNTINALLCKFEFGCQLFSSQDEVVRLNDVERFYWSVKSLNLARMVDAYQAEAEAIGPSHVSLTATIMQLRKQVQSDLQEADAHVLQHHQNENNTAQAGIVHVPPPTGLFHPL